MRKHEGVVRLALNHNFEKALRKALEPAKPVTVPTDEADKAKIDQRGHEVFESRRVK